MANEALRDLAGAFLPLAVRSLQREIDERVRKIPTPVNEFGYDPYGWNPGYARRLTLFSVLLYKYWFRARCFDIDRVPAGPVLLIGNHAGQLPFDGAMLATAMLLEAEPPRVARAMGEFWIPQLPFVSVVAARTGTLVGTPENCVEMLRAGECVMVFPEGVRGINKLWSQRYRLQRFGLGFMRLALETGAPIVPVSIVGSDDQQPGLASLGGLARVLGMPAFPITPTFPWLGPLGLWPLPVRYRIYFGEPLRFEGSPDEEDAAIEEKVAAVKRAIEAGLRRGLRERRHPFD